MKRAVGLHPRSQLAKAQEMFAVARPGEDAKCKREMEIEALPVVVWRGKRLRTIRCTGITGRGPHDCNVPEAMLWSLIDFRRFRCPFHAVK